MDFFLEMIQNSEKKILLFRMLASNIKCRAYCSFQNMESCICIQVSNNKCPKVMEEILNIPNLLHICNLLRNVTKNNKIQIIRADMALIYFTRRHSHASSNAKVCNFFANEAIWAALHINHCKTFV